MISPEILRRYSFFRQLSDEQMKGLAMISNEVQYGDKETILEEGDPANVLYFLLEGSVDLFYVVEQNFHSDRRKEVLVGEINPGEPFGISTLIEPFEFTSTARSSGDSRVIRIEIEGLRKLLDEDSAFEILMLRRIGKAALERLNATRIQLAAAWS